MEFDINDKIKSLYKINCETIEQIDENANIKQINLFISNLTDNTLYARYNFFNGSLSCIKFKSDIKMTLFSFTVSLYYLDDYISQNKELFEVYEKGNKLLVECDEKQIFLQTICENFYTISIGLGHYHSLIIEKPEQILDDIKKLITEIEEKRNQLENLTHNIYKIKESEDYDTNMLF